MDDPQELISELAKVFDKQAEAEALLTEIGYPRERTQSSQRSS